MTSLHPSNFKLKCISNYYKI